MDCWAMMRKGKASPGLVTARIACNLVLWSAGLSLEKEMVPLELSQPESPVTWCFGELGCDERDKAFPQPCHAQNRT